MVSSYGGHYLPLFSVMLLCNFLVPLPLLCLKKVRRSIPAIFAVSLVVNVGMWAERALIVIPSLARRNDPSIWHNYFPTWVEISYITGSIAMFALLYLLFSKVLPVMAISDIKEHLFRTTDRPVGGTIVPSMADDEGGEGGKP